MQEKRAEDKYAYDQEYLKQNVTLVNISFNQKKEEDMIILNWLNSLPGSRTAYIKNLIREDMQKNGA